MKIIENIYFTSPQLSLSGEKRIFELKSLTSYKNQLYYEKDIIGENSLILYYHDEIIGEYSSEKIAKNLEYFRKRLDRLEQANKFFPVPVSFVLGNRIVTIREMMKIEIKKLADELFK